MPIVIGDLTAPPLDHTGTKNASLATHNADAVRTIVHNDRPPDKMISTDSSNTNSNSSNDLATIPGRIHANGNCETSSPVLLSPAPSALLCSSLRDRTESVTQECSALYIQRIRRARQELRLLRARRRASQEAFLADEMAAFAASCSASAAKKATQIKELAVDATTMAQIRLDDVEEHHTHQLQPAPILQQARKPPRYASGEIKEGDDRCARKENNIAREMVLRRVGGFHPLDQAPTHENVCPTIALSPVKIAGKHRNTSASDNCITQLNSSSANHHPVSPLYRLDLTNALQLRCAPADAEMSCDPLITVRSKSPLLAFSQGAATAVKTTAATVTANALYTDVDCVRVYEWKLSACVEVEKLTRQCLCAEERAAAVVLSRIDAQVKLFQRVTLYPTPLPTQTWMRESGVLFQGDTAGMMGRGALNEHDASRESANSSNAMAGATRNVAIHIIDSCDHTMKGNCHGKNAKSRQEDGTFGKKGHRGDEQRWVHHHGALGWSPSPLYALLHNSQPSYSQYSCRTDTDTNSTSPDDNTMHENGSSGANSKSISGGSNSESKSSSNNSNPSVSAAAANHGHDLNPDEQHLDGAPHNRVPHFRRTRYHPHPHPHPHHLCQQQKDKERLLQHSQTHGQCQILFAAEQRERALLLLHREELERQCLLAAWRQQSEFPRAHAQARAALLQREAQFRDDLEHENRLWWHTISPRFLDVCLLALGSAELNARLELDHRCLCEFYALYDQVSAFVALVRAMHYLVMQEASERSYFMSTAESALHFTRARLWERHRQLEIVTADESARRTVCMREETAARAQLWREYYNTVAWMRRMAAAAGARGSECDGGGGRCTGLLAECRQGSAGCGDQEDDNAGTRHGMNNVEDNDTSNGVCATHDAAIDGCAGQDGANSPLPGRVDATLLSPSGATAALPTAAKRGNGRVRALAAPPAQTYTQNIYDGGCPEVVRRRSRRCTSARMAVLLSVTSRCTTRTRSRSTTERLGAITVIHNASQRSNCSTEACEEAGARRRQQQQQQQQQDAEDERMGEVEKSKAAALRDAGGDDPSDTGTNARKIDPHNNTGDCLIGTANITEASAKQGDQNSRDHVQHENASGNSSSGSTKQLGHTHRLGILITTPTHLIARNLRRRQRGVVMIMQHSAAEETAQRDGDAPRVATPPNLPPRRNALLNTLKSRYVAAWSHTPCHPVTAVQEDQQDDHQHEQQRQRGDGMESAPNHCSDGECAVEKACDGVCTSPLSPLQSRQSLLIDKPGDMDDGGYAIINHDDARSSGRVDFLDDDERKGGHGKRATNEDMDSISSAISRIIDDAKKKHIARNKSDRRGNPSKAMCSSKNGSMSSTRRLPAAGSASHLGRYHSCLTENENNDTGGAGSMSNTQHQQHPKLLRPRRISSARLFARRLFSNIKSAMTRAPDTARRSSSAGDLACADGRTRRLTNNSTCAAAGFTALALPAIKATCNPGTVDHWHVAPPLANIASSTAEAEAEAGKATNPVGQCSTESGPGVLIRTTVLSNSTSKHIDRDALNKKSSGKHSSQSKCSRSFHEDKSNGCILQRFRPLNEVLQRAKAQKTVGGFCATDSVAGRDNAERQLLARTTAHGANAAMQSPNVENDGEDDDADSFGGNGPKQFMLFRHALRHRSIAVDGVVGGALHVREVSTQTHLLVTRAQQMTQILYEVLELDECVRYGMTVRDFVDACAVVGVWRVEHTRAQAGMLNKFTAVDAGKKDNRGDASQDTHPRRGAERERCPHDRADDDNDRCPSNTATNDVCTNTTNNHSTAALRERQGATNAVPCHAKDNMSDTYTRHETNAHSARPAVLPRLMQGVGKGDAPSMASSMLLMSLSSASTSALQIAAPSLTDATSASASALSRGPWCSPHFVRELCKFISHTLDHPHAPHALIELLRGAPRGLPSTLLSGSVVCVPLPWESVVDVEKLCMALLCTLATLTTRPASSGTESDATVAQTTKATSRVAVIREGEVDHIHVASDNANKDVKRVWAKHDSDAGMDMSAGAVGRDSERKDVPLFASALSVDRIRASQNAIHHGTRTEELVHAKERVHEGDLHSPDDDAEEDDMHTDSESSELMSHSDSWPNMTAMNTRIKQKMPTKGGAEKGGGNVARSAKNKSSSSLLMLAQGNCLPGLARTLTAAAVRRWTHQLVDGGLLPLRLEWCSRDTHVRRGVFDLLLGDSPTHGRMLRMTFFRQLFLSSHALRTHPTTGESPHTTATVTATSRATMYAHANADTSSCSCCMSCDKGNPNTTTANTSNLHSLARRNENDSCSDESFRAGADGMYIRESGTPYLAFSYYLCQRGIGDACTLTTLLQRRMQACFSIPSCRLPSSSPTPSLRLRARASDGRRLVAAAVHAQPPPGMLLLTSVHGTRGVSSHMPTFARMEQNRMIQRGGDLLAALCDAQQQLLMTVLREGEEAAEEIELRSLSHVSEKNGTGDTEDVAPHAATGACTNREYKSACDAHDTTCGNNTNSTSRINATRTDCVKDDDADAVTRTEHVCCRPKDGLRAHPVTLDTHLRTHMEQAEAEVIADSNGQEATTRRTAGNSVRVVEAVHVSDAVVTAILRTLDMAAMQRLTGECLFILTLLLIWLPHPHPEVTHEHARDTTVSRAQRHLCDKQGCTRSTPPLSLTGTDTAAFDTDAKSRNTSTHATNTTVSNGIDESRSNKERSADMSNIPLTEPPRVASIHNASTDLTTPSLTCRIDVNKATRRESVHVVTVPSTPSCPACTPVTATSTAANATSHPRMTFRRAYSHSEGMQPCSQAADWPQHSLLTSPTAWITPSSTSIQVTRLDVPSEQHNSEEHKQQQHGTGQDERRHACQEYTDTKQEHQCDSNTGMSENAYREAECYRFEAVRESWSQRIACLVNRLVDLLWVHQTTQRVFDEVRAGVGEVWTSHTRAIQVRSIGTVSCEDGVRAPASRATAMRRLCGQTVRLFYDVLTHNIAECGVQSALLDCYNSMNWTNMTSNPDGPKMSRPMSNIDSSREDVVQNEGRNDCTNIEDHNDGVAEGSSKHVLEDDSNRRARSDCEDARRVSFRRSRCHECNHLVAGLLHHTCISACALSAAQAHLSHLPPAPTPRMSISALLHRPHDTITSAASAVDDDDDDEADANVTTSHGLLPHLSARQRMYEARDDGSYDAKSKHDDDDDDDDNDDDDESSNSFAGARADQQGAALSCDEADRRNVDEHTSSEKKSNNNEGGKDGSDYASKMNRPVQPASSSVPCSSGSAASSRALQSVLSLMHTALSESWLCLGNRDIDQMVAFYVDEHDAHATGLLSASRVSSKDNGNNSTRDDDDSDSRADQKCGSWISNSKKGSRRGSERVQLSYASTPLNLSTTTKTLSTSDSKDTTATVSVTMTEQSCGVAFAAHFNAVLHAAMRYVRVMWRAGRWMREMAAMTVVSAAAPRQQRDNAHLLTTRMPQYPFDHIDPGGNRGNMFGRPRDGICTDRHNTTMNNNRHDRDKDDDEEDCYHVGATSAPFAADGLMTLPLIDWNSPACNTAVTRTQQSFAESMIQHAECLKSLCCRAQTGCLPFREKRLRHGWGAFKMDKVSAMTASTSPKSCAMNS